MHWVNLNTASLCSVPGCDFAIRWHYPFPGSMHGLCRRSRDAPGDRSEEPRWAGSGLGDEQPEPITYSAWHLSISGGTREISDTLVSLFQVRWIGNSLFSSCAQNKLAHMHAHMSRYMAMHAPTCRFIPIHAPTCRYIYMHAPTCYML